MIFRRRQRGHEQDVQEDTLITEAESPECESVSPTETDITGNGSIKSNGHVVAQVHYVRPTKGGKKNKDSNRNKRTSYHLTVADDETAMIDNEVYSNTDNT